MSDDPFSHIEIDPDTDDTPEDDSDLGQKRAALRAARFRSATPRTRDDAAIGGTAHPGPAERRNEPTRESWRGDVDENAIFTRRGRAQQTTGGFDIPAHRKKPGWDYQYNTIRVLNQPVDGSEIRNFRENGGWRPVMAKDWPELADDGAAPDSPIETGGQRLYERPMRLTMEAREEDHAYALQQQRDRMMAAAAGKSAVRGEEGISTRGVRPVPVSIEIEGLAG